MFTYRELMRTIAWALAAAAMLAGAPAQAQPVTATTPRLIVKFRADGARAALGPEARVDALSAQAGSMFVRERTMATGAQVLRLLQALPVDAAQALARRLAADPDVLYARPDYVRRRAQVSPNDPYFLNGSQLYFDNSAGGIDMIDAWSLTTGSAATVVAVVDGGITAHPELSGRILPGYCFITDPTIANNSTCPGPDATDPGDWMTAADVANPDFAGQGCTVSDSSWHGTAVTGIIVANTNNGVGMAGIDWLAQSIPVRVLGKCFGDDADILDGLSWAGGLAVPGVPANPNPAQVVNMSLGGTPGCDSATQDVIDQVLAHGATRAIVVAAGNESHDVTNDAPAGCTGVITVAATSRTGNLATYSNFGAGVAISAPGGDDPNFPSDAILTLGNTGTTTVDPNGYAYYLYDGTSVATPMVTGVVSLMLAVAPGLTSSQVRQILTSTAKPFPAGSTCSTANCGAGILDARAAVAAAQAAAGAPTINAQGLWWAADGTESGWGINFAHQGSQIFATWYTYDTTGRAWWLTMLASQTNGNSYSGPIYVDSGPPFNNYTGSATASAVGSGVVYFADVNDGSFSYSVSANGAPTVSQTKAIARYSLGGAQPTCTYSASTPDYATATNYQDLWWVANGAENGWGINFAHQGSQIFATWYTYNVGHSPLWLTALVERQGNGNVFTGPIYQNSGPRYDAYDASKVVASPVGTATLAFADGDDATFVYTVTIAPLPGPVTQSKELTRFPFAATGGTVCQ